VVLVNAATRQSVLSREVDVHDGTYPYRFDDVPPGDYHVYAGSDADNDGFICDPGEACGAWPTLNLPVAVRLPASRSGLDFLTGYATGIQAASSGRGPGPVSRAPSVPR
jgi:serine protease